MKDVVVCTADQMAVTEEYDSYYDYDENPDYSLHYENEGCNTNNVMQFGIIFNMVFFPIMVILSLLGNNLVIVILVKYENLKSLTNAFILNLAVSDLLFTAGLPFWAYYYKYGWTLGEPACKTITFIFNLGFYSSGLVLILMTAQRYVAVVRPLSGVMSRDGLQSVLASAIIWAASALAACPAAVNTKLSQDTCEYADSYWSLWGMYQQNILFLLSSAVFIFCYSQIMFRLLRPTAQRRKKKTLKLIFCLVVVFFVSWTPYNTVIFIRSLYFWHQEPAISAVVAAACQGYIRLDYALYISRILACSHCCLNPVFYVFLGVKYRAHLKKMLKSLRNSKGTTNIRSRQSRLTITSLTSGEEVSI